MKHVSRFISVLAVGSVLLLGACHPKKLPVPPPPTPPPPAPTASLTANPNSVQKGESTTLTWETTNATDVQIDGVGPVNPTGSRQVTPTDSTTYRLVAKGSGGSQEATARVTVEGPPANSVTLCFDISILRSRWPTPKRTPRASWPAMDTVGKSKSRVVQMR